MIDNAINDFVIGYCSERGLAGFWLRAIVKFVDANHPELPRLKDLVTDTHHLPGDFLPDPKIIVLYFLPFSREAVQSNKAGRYASRQWVKSYLLSKALLAAIDTYVVDLLRRDGYRAARPVFPSYIGEGIYKSGWSYRHIARLGGMGTFGLHNMLITDSGSCGYYSSVITGLAVEPDVPLAEERCLYKRDGSCGACVKQCVAGALTFDGFDRVKCHAMCMENAERYGDSMGGLADACGKCLVGLPCSMGNPAALPPRSL